MTLRTSIQNQQTRKSFHREVGREEMTFKKATKIIRKVQNNDPNRICNIRTYQYEQEKQLITHQNIILL